MENIETLIENIKIKTAPSLKRDEKLFADVQENQDRIRDLFIEREDYEALCKLKKILGYQLKPEDEELYLANLDSEAEELYRLYDGLNPVR